MILELYLLSLLESVRGGEGSAVTDWTEQEMVEGRLRELTLREGRRGLQGKRVARGEKMVAYMTARGEEGLKKVFLAAQCVWRDTSKVKTLRVRRKILNSDRYRKIGFFW